MAERKGLVEGIMEYMGKSNKPMSVSYPKKKEEVNLLEIPKGRSKGVGLASVGPLKDYKKMK